MESAMTQMKWIVRQSLITGALLIAATPLTLGLPQQQACTDAIIHGRYGFLMTGTHIGFGLYALMGTIEADGTGHFRGNGLQTLNGEQAERSFTATYHVTPECNGVTEITFENKTVAHERFVVVEGGNEVLLMDDAPHTIETGSAKRQFVLESSDNGSVKPQ
jgi:hypothetical protein